MGVVYRDSILSFDEYYIGEDEDIFARLIEEKKSDYFDQDRFFLRYISSADLAKYDFNDTASLDKFRDDCVSSISPLKGMG